MSQPKSIKFDAYQILPGETPRKVALAYKWESESNRYEPAWESLRALLPGVDMLERVTMGGPFAVWCDEEGRLKADAKASCVIRGGGDFVGPIVLCYDVLLKSPVGASKSRMRLSLFKFGVIVLGKPPADYVPDEPHVEVFAMGPDGPEVL
jgi:hypothetical protein